MRACISACVRACMRALLRACVCAYVQVKLLYEFSSWRLMFHLADPALILPRYVLTFRSQDAEEREQEG